MYKNYLFLISFLFFITGCVTWDYLNGKYDESNLKPQQEELANINKQIKEEQLKKDKLQEEYIATIDEMAEIQKRINKLNDQIYKNKMNQVDSKNEIREIEELKNQKRLKSEKQKRLKEQLEKLGKVIKTY